MTKITPFRINIAQADLDDLHRRLASARWPEDLPDVGWSYGIPTSYVQELSQYWSSGFDWRTQEAAWNQYPQFIAEFEAQRLHFLHIRSAEPDALPLVLVHGWPFEDFTAMIGPLTDPVAHGGGPNDAFHLVIPTLPGFGFSGTTDTAGAASTANCAELIARLMTELGYDQYGAQGGDAGSFIVPELGRIARGHVVGIHLNDPITIPSFDDDGSDYRASDRKKLAQVQDWSSRQGSAYASVHGTRPQTLAPALSDSPVGMLAWVLDVVNTFKDPAKATPTDSIDRDVLLTNLSILWFTNTAGSSMRWYKESPHWNGDKPSDSGVPTGIAVFPGNRTIQGIAEREHTVVRWSEMERGGHFAPMEAPDLVIGDLRELFRELG